MRRVLCALLLATFALACEPPDTGGGGGVGGKLAFIRDGQLGVSLDSGDQERLLTDQNTSLDPALSPNGVTVAFAFAEGGDLTKTSIETVPFAGTTRTPLATPDAGHTFVEPSWSRDGASVVFVDVGPTNQLMTVDAAGGTPSPIGPAITGDVRWPAYVSATMLVVTVGGELETLDLSAGTVNDLGVQAQGRAAVSPDGTKIAYSRASDGVVVLRLLATGAETPLAATGFGDHNPTFSPDGTLVAFDAKGPSDSSPKIYDVSADGTGGTMLLQSGSEPSWSP